MQIIDLKGSRMPALGFGTWELRGSDCPDAVRIALETGYRHVDTAQIYGNEAEVGQGLSESGVAREDIFLTTKIWRENFMEGRAKESVDESLSKLRTDYVDLLLIHWPFSEVSIKEMVEALVAIQESGKARQIGVSNFTVAQMEEAKKISGDKIACNQVEYHPYLSQKAVHDFTIKNDWVMTAYCPIARGRVMKDPVINEIGLKHGKNATQVTLRWLVQQEKVAAIPKSSSAAHIKSNFEIFDFELTPEDMNKISALAKPDGRLVNPGWAPKWDKAA